MRKMRNTGPISTYNRVLAKRVPDGTDVGKSLLGQLGAGEAYLIVSLAVWSGNETQDSSPKKTPFQQEIELDLAILKAPMVKMDGNQALKYQHKVQRYEAVKARLKAAGIPLDLLKEEQ